MTQTQRAVSFTGAVRTFGEVRAVDGIDLEINRGETVALLGRNGAGKSTTISLLLGLAEPDEGSVELFGAAPERSVRAGLVGAMLQEARPVPRVTVGELVSFVASRYPEPMPVARALELAGIGELVGRRVDRLSGGQGWGRPRSSEAESGGGCGSRWPHRPDRAPRDGGRITTGLSCAARGVHGGRRTPAGAGGVAARWHGHDACGDLTAGRLPLGAGPQAQRGACRRVSAGDHPCVAVPGEQYAMAYRSPSLGLLFCTATSQPVPPSLW
ncbi:ATP-binding cassette domain-containing protein [Streptomyces sp. V3I7]|uniref:ATP-binding cassette domain-containing protein n=1 Tax=Streptomyces sp. V3I7 TaxID=3042278 RepID=UPI002784F62D|nr:ATP-binding cassette domain-containing protein [Streptomyces sp. V3I7]MDQ0990588.1 hypothetical protein [Streptomyces sp. V3I7]